jgi:predicted ATP-grasp superfamily ATP-dependent carboligase
VNPPGADIDALLLDAHARQALVAMRDLGRAGLAVGAVDVLPGAPAFASRFCARSQLVSGFTADAARFVEDVRELAGAWNAKVVFPSHDGAIEAIREHRARLEEVAAVALAAPEALDVAVDKKRTLAAGAAVGIAVPRGAIVTTLAVAEAVLDEVGVPAVVKPSQSWISEGDAQRRLGTAIGRTREETLAEVEDIIASGTAAAVQEWLPGERLALSFVYGGGRFAARFAQRAVRMLPPIGGSSILRESIPLPADATAQAERLIRELELEGYCEIEFRRDRDGRPVLMEINPRLSASVEVAVRAGVPFPRLLYRWAAGEPLPEPAPYRTGVWMRWLGGDLAWLGQALAERGHPDLPGPARGLGRFARDFLRRSGYDYFDRRDLGPAAAAVRLGARRLPARAREAPRAVRRHRRAV